MSALARVFASKRPLIWGLVLSGTTRRPDGFRCWAPVTHTPRYMGVLASGVL